jgi:hypothetical protein
MDLAHLKGPSFGQTEEVPSTRFWPFGELDKITFSKKAKLNIQYLETIGRVLTIRTSPRTPKSEFI